jgi:hypothetical protein
MLTRPLSVHFHWVAVLDMWLSTGSVMQMMRVDLTKFNKRFGIAKVAAKAYVGKDLCCEAELTLVLAK